MILPKMCLKILIRIVLLVQIAHGEIYDIYDMSKIQLQTSNFSVAIWKHISSNPETWQDVPNFAVNGVKECGDKFLNVFLTSIDPAFVSIYIDLGVPRKICNVIFYERNGRTFNVEVDGNPFGDLSKEYRGQYVNAETKSPTKNVHLCEVDIQSKCFVPDIPKLFKRRITSASCDECHNILSGAKFENTNKILFQPFYYLEEQMAWFTFGFDDVMLVKEVVMLSSVEVLFLVTKFSIAYRIGADREFVMYTEDGLIKVFDAGLNTAASTYYIFSFKNSLLASEVRVHLPNNQGQTVIFSCSLRGYNATRQYELINHHYAASVAVSIFPNMPDVSITLPSAHQISGIIIDNPEKILRFTVNYVLDGISYAYKDHPVTNATTIFFGAKKMNLKPFVADTVILSNLEVSSDMENDNTSFHLIGQDKLVDHEWSMSEPMDKDTLIDTFYLYHDIAGREPLVSNAVDLQKRSPEEQARSNYIGADCYTQPQLCDSGFSVAVDFEEQLNRSVETIIVVPKPYKSYYKVHESCDFAGIGDYQFLGYHSSNTWEYSVALQYMFLNLPGYVDIVKAELLLPDVGDVSSVDIHLIPFYDLNEGNSLINLNKLPCSTAPDGHPLNGDFKFVLYHTIVAHALNVTEGFKKIVSQKFGVLAHVAIYIIPTIYRQEGAIVSFKNIELNIDYRVKVPPVITPFMQVPVFDGSHLTISVETPMVLTGIQIRNLPASITAMGIEVENTEYMPDRKTYTYTVDDKQELEIMGDGDGVTLKLRFPILFKTMRLSLWGGNIRKNFRDNMSLVLHGATPDFESGVEVFPIISAGIAGTKTNNTGTGFSIYYDDHGFLNAIVHTNNAIYTTEYYMIDSTFPISVFVTWKKDSGLYMYINGNLVDEKAVYYTNYNRTAIVDNEYFLIFGQYSAPFSYLATKLSKIRTWKKYLTESEVNEVVTRPEKHIVHSDEVSKYHLGSSCVCIQTSCPCESLGSPITVSYNSKSISVYGEQGGQYQLIEKMNVGMGLDAQVINFTNVNIDFEYLKINNMKLLTKFGGGHFQEAVCRAIHIGQHLNRSINWCEDNWHDAVLESPDLTDIFFNYKKLGGDSSTLSFRINGGPFPGAISTLQITYLPPDKSLLMYLRANIVKTSKIFKRINIFENNYNAQCLNFSYKRSGRGFAHLSIMAASTELHRIYPAKVDEDQWYEGEINITGRTTIKLWAVLNGLNDGYFAVKDMVSSMTPCGGAAVNPSVNYEEMKEKLRLSHFPIPLFVIPFEEDLTVLSSQNVSVQSYFEERKIDNAFGSMVIDVKRQETVISLAKSIALNEFTLVFWITYEDGYSLKFQNVDSSMILEYIEFEGPGCSVTSGSDVYTITGGLSYQWTHMIMKYNGRKEILEIFRDMELKDVLSGLKIGETELAKLRLSGGSISCLQMYHQLLDETEMLQTRWCPIHHSTEACPGTMSCGICNQFTGEWEVHSSMDQSINKHCQHALHSYANILHFTMDTIKDGVIENIKLTDEKIVLDHSSKRFDEVGILNNALCIQDDKKELLLNWTAATCESCYAAFWIKHHCQDDLLLQTPWFNIHCANSYKQLITIAYKSCNYTVTTKIGLWYHLIVIINDESVDIYFNGNKTSPVADCGDASSFNSEPNIYIGPSKNGTCFDELMFGIGTLTYADVLSIYDFYTPGNETSFNHIKNLYMPIKIDAKIFLSRTDWNKYYANPGSFGQYLLSKYCVSELYKLMNGTVALIEDLYQYSKFSEQEVKGQFSFYFNNLNDESIELLSRKNYIVLEMNMHNNERFSKFAGSDIEYLSKVSSTNIVEVYKTEAVFQWHQDFTIPKQPIVSLRLHISSAPRDPYIEEASNTDRISLTNLKPFTHYSVRIQPIPISGSPSVFSQMNALEFQTLEGEPSEAPNITNCDPQYQTKVRSILCKFQNIDVDQWNGIEFGFEYLYTNESFDNSTDVNSWNISGFSSVKKQVAELNGFLQFEFVTESVYTIYTIVLRALTAQGYGYGVRSYYYQRSFIGAPGLPPTEFSLRLIASEIQLTWTPLEQDEEIWNGGDDTLREYLIEWGTHNLVGDSLVHTPLMTTTVAFNESSIMIPTLSETNLVEFTLKATTNKMAGPLIVQCLAMPVEVPKMKLNITVDVINSSAVAVTVVSMGLPFFWRGNKYVVFNITGRSKQLQNPERKVDMMFTHDIESFQNQSRICDKNFIKSYFQQNLTRTIVINQLDHYENYDMITKACNELGCENNNYVYSFQTGEYTPTCYPSNITVFNTSSTSVQAVWEEISQYCTNGIITEYIVRARIPRTNNTSEQAMELEEISFANLPKFSKICVQVAGRTVVGVGVFSPEICAFTAEEKPGIIPTIAGVWNVTSTIIKISILPKDEISANCLIRGVNVTYKRIEAVLHKQFLNSSSQYDHEVTEIASQTFLIDHAEFFNSANPYHLLVFNLSSYHIYEYSLQYLSVIGDGNSTATNVWWTAEGAPTISPNVTVNEITSTNATFIWTQVPDFLWNGRPHSFNITVIQNYRNMSVRAEVFPVSYTRHSFSVHHLLPFTNCTVMVTPCTIGDCSLNERWIYFQTQESAPIGIVELVLTSKESTTLQFEWSEVPIMERNGIILDYQAILVDPVNNEVVFNESVIRAPLQIINLVKYHEYKFTIKARNSVSLGPEHFITVMTDEGIPSLPPVNVSSTGVTGTSILVFWRDIPDEGQHGVVSYIIFYNEILPNGSLGYTYIAHSGNLTHHLLTGLTRDGVYNISVAGQTIKGIGVKSFVITGETGFYVDGNWTEWTDWGYCSVSCGGGVSLRTRTCTNPSPIGTGYNCTGNSTESRECGLESCSGFYLTPAGQLDCKMFCESKGILCSPIINTNNKSDIFNSLENAADLNCSSYQTMETLYSKDFHPAFDYENKICVGYEGTPMVSVCEAKDVNPSMGRICYCLNSNDVGFGEWAGWSLCNASCGVSKKTRKRICYSLCTGNDAQNKACDVPECPVDGQWGNWTEFSECNKTCGYGYRSRTRACDNPPTAHGGMKCPGPNIDVRPGCNTTPCKVHGGEGEWSEWGICESPCGVSKSTRQRYCDNPIPAYRGDPCSEPLVEERICNLTACIPIEMDYVVRLSEETWKFNYNYMDKPDTKNITKRVIENVYNSYENSSFIKNVIVHSFSKGSVIADFLIEYKYINRDQVVSFLDLLESSKLLGDMPLDEITYTSPTIQCYPPKRVSCPMISLTSCNMTWSNYSCAIRQQLPFLYLYYRPYAEDKPARNLTNLTWLVTGISENKSWIILKDLKPRQNYKGYLVPSLSIGNGPPSLSIIIETPIGPPNMKPQEVLSVSTSPTKIFMDWKDIPEHARNGPLSGYIIRYWIYVEENEKYVKYVDFGFTTTVLTELKPFSTYLIQISGYNVAGEGEFEFAVTDTLEGVPSVPVPNFFVNDMEAIDWWSVSWGRIPDDKVNGILRGYRLTYVMTFKSGIEIGKGATVTTLDFDIFTFYYKARNLVNYATYSVSVSGFTNAGDGPADQYDADTCRCKEHLFANWYESPPYTALNGADNLTGFFPPLLKETLIAVCGSCKPYQQSQLHFFISKSGEPPEKDTEFRLKNSITADVDLSFPIYGTVAREMIAPDSVFLMLVSSPGCAMIVRDEAKLAGTVNQMIMNVFKVWPLLLVSYSIATLFGILIWFIDQFKNPEEFSLGHSLKGPLAGFWFGFVSMTTVGYGDVTPRSFWGKSFSMLWVLIGIVLNSIIVGFISTSLTTLGLPKEVKLYNTKTAALNNSFEYRYAVLRNAVISSERFYKDVPSMLDALASKEVDAVLVDTYTMTSYKDLLQRKLQKVKALIKTNTGYGFVLGGLSQALRPDVESMVKGREKEVAEFIASMKDKIPDLTIEKKGESTKDLFSGQSEAFLKSVFYMGAMIGGACFFGIIYEIIRCRSRTRKVHPEKPKTMEEHVDDVNVLVKNLLVQVKEVSESAEIRHAKEVLSLYTIKQNYLKKSKNHGQKYVERIVTKSFGPDVMKKGRVYPLKRISKN